MRLLTAHPCAPARRRACSLAHSPACFLLPASALLLPVRRVSACLRLHSLCHLLDCCALAGSDRAPVAGVRAGAPQAAADALGRGAVRARRSAESNGYSGEDSALCFAFLLCSARACLTVAASVWPRLAYLAPCDPTSHICPAMQLSSDRHCAVISCARAQNVYRAAGVPYYDKSALELIASVGQVRLLGPSSAAHRSLCFVVCSPRRFSSVPVWLVLLCPPQIAAVDLSVVPAPFSLCGPVAAREPDLLCRSTTRSSGG